MGVNESSTEAEVRAILENAERPAERIRMGDALAALGRKIGLKDEDFAVFEQARDKKPAEPVRLVASRDTGPYQAPGLQVINPWET
ncbi:hypothetical protein [Thiobacter aerophilum]|uniref:Uncharacterized protein n=1 Tax=Thiobacter aerophilum TaxID=3121275 RepID=A0ABV0EH10_9BURK